MKKPALLSPVQKIPAPPTRRLTVSSAMMLLTLLTLAATGCTGPRPLHGGKAVTAGSIVQTLAQGENPSIPSRQAQETIKIRTYAFPPALDTRPSSSPSTPDTRHFLVSEREETRAHTELGAAQKDTARELGAKLSSLKSIMWVGVALFVLGVASFAWPPLKAIVGSVTTSAAITLGGVALMILPTLVVGHELLIIGGVAVTVGAWFLAHRHGRLHGELSATSRHLRNLWTPDL